MESQLHSTQQMNLSVIKNAIDMNQQTNMEKSL